MSASAVLSQNSWKANNTSTPTGSDLKTTTTKNISFPLVVPPTRNSSLPRFSRPPPDASEKIAIESEERDAGSLEIDTSKLHSLLPQPVALSPLLGPKMAATITASPVATTTMLLAEKLAGNPKGAPQIDIDRSSFALDDLKPFSWFPNEAHLRVHDKIDEEEEEQEDGEKSKPQSIYELDTRRSMTPKLSTTLRLAISDATALGSQESDVVPPVPQLPLSQASDVSRPMTKHSSHSQSTIRPLQISPALAASAMLNSERSADSLSSTQTTASTNYMTSPNSSMSSVYTPGPIDSEPMKSQLSLIVEKEDNPPIAHIALASKAPRHISSTLSLRSNATTVHTRNVSDGVSKSRTGSTRTSFNKPLPPAPERIRPTINTHARSPQTPRVESIISKTPNSLGVPTPIETPISASSERQYTPARRSSKGSLVSAQLRSRFAQEGQPLPPLQEDGSSQAPAQEEEDYDHVPVSALSSAAPLAAFATPISPMPLSSISSAPPGENDGYFPPPSRSESVSVAKPPKRGKQLSSKPSLGLMRQFSIFRNKNQSTLSVTSSSPTRPKTNRSYTSNAVLESTPQAHNVETPRRSLMTPAMSRASMGSKADRILGKGPAFETLSPLRTAIREENTENWNNVVHSPTKITDTSKGAQMTSDVEDDFVDEEHERHFLSSPPQAPAADAHFEEIRARLALLNPLSSISYTEEPAPISTSPTKHRRRKSKRIQSKRESISPALVAELEAVKIASPVELEGSFSMPSGLGISNSSAPGKVESEQNLFMIPESPLAQTTQTTEEFEAAYLKVPAEPKPKSRKESFTDTTSHHRSMTSARSLKARSLASLVVSEIADIYAGLPGAGNRSSGAQTRSSVAQTNHSRSQSHSANLESDLSLSPDEAEAILLRILQSVESLQDLFAAAEVSRGFYRTFKIHESSLLRNALWHMSPPAWELREITCPKDIEAKRLRGRAHPYFRAYVDDLLQLVELKSLILTHCKSFLRTETIAALSGETSRSADIDNALWRVWTFCILFGGETHRENDIVGQMDWLRGGVIANSKLDAEALASIEGIQGNSVLYDKPPGFAEGNEGGLSTAQLFDMTEIWTCLAVLLRGYHSERVELREIGVFQGHEVLTSSICAAEDENAIIEEWTLFVLAQGPSAVLSIAAPFHPSTACFERVIDLGFASWTLPSEGGTRATFLKEAISRVYDELVHTPTSTSPKLPLDAASPVLNLIQESDSDLQERRKLNRERTKRHAREIKAIKTSESYKDVPVSEDRPMSNYAEAMRLIELDKRKNSWAAAPIPIPRRKSSSGRKQSLTSTLPLGLVNRKSSTRRNSTETSRSQTSTSQPSTQKRLSIFTSMPKSPKKLNPFRAPIRDSSQAPQAASVLTLSSVSSTPTPTLGLFPPLISPSKVHFSNALHPRQDLLAARLASIDRLVSLGYGSDMATRAVDSVLKKAAKGKKDSANCLGSADVEDRSGIDFDVVLGKAKKLKEREERLERIKRMG